MKKSIFYLPAIERKVAAQPMDDILGWIYIPTMNGVIVCLDKATSTDIYHEMYIDVHVV